MAIITFNDIHGVEQTLDTRQKFNVAFNADCMDILRAMPDKCIDLIVADPPYGDGNPDNEDEHRNQRGRFDRYNESSQSVQVEREREREREATATRKQNELQGRRWIASSPNPDGFWGDRLEASGNGGGRTIRHNRSAREENSKGEEPG